MEINISIQAEDEEELEQKIDVALFKIGKELPRICRLKVDEEIEVAHAKVFRSA